MEDDEEAGIKTLTMIREGLTALFHQYYGRVADSLAPIFSLR